MADSAPAATTEYQSRRRREIAQIMADMDSQLTALAESHHETAARRSKLRYWKVNIIERARLVALAKRGGASMMNRALRKGFNGWLDMILRRVTALLQLQAAASK